MTATADAVRRLLGSNVIASTALAGGDLSHVSRLTLADGRIVITKRAATASAEAIMLQAIHATGAPAPAVLAVEGDLLMMESIAAGAGPSAAWPDLAHVLALLHGAPGASYGWPVDHAFGPVAIPNCAAQDWPNFWADQRLRCHLPFVRPALASRLETLAARLADHLPQRPLAALLHGDLWGGNILVAGSRVAALIDPACYHGDREVDVAMLTLFDHPPPDFFAALALQPGWRDRQPIYRLWPLLVHLRLFGDAYAGAVDRDLSMLGV